MNEKLYEAPIGNIHTDMNNQHQIQDDRHDSNLMAHIGLQQQPLIVHTTQYSLGIPTNTLFLWLWTCYYT